jgi:hypothetical protein
MRPNAVGRFTKLFFNASPDPDTFTKVAVAQKLQALKRNKNVNRWYANRFEVRVTLVIVPKRATLSAHTWLYAHWP